MEVMSSFNSPRRQPTIFRPARVASSSLKLKTSIWTSTRSIRSGSNWNWCGHATRFGGGDRRADQYREHAARGHCYQHHNPGHALGREELGPASTASTRCDGRLRSVWGGTLGTNYATNGAETQQNAFHINGVDTADISLNSAGIIPSPDAIAEFHLVTSTINPEFGRNSGAIMNAVIKSGSNTLHGDGFDFYRDTFLNARNFFQQSVSPYHQNQYGGTVGGPIRLPHVYNGRDKTFFFFSYQGIRNVVPQAYSVPHVYTAAQRGGAFSDLATSTGISSKPLVGDNGTTYPAGTPYSTIFSAGTIPAADMDPLATKLMNQYVPVANAPNNGYQFNPSIAHTTDQYISRIDQNFGSKDSIWGYMYWERNPTTETLPFAGAHLPGFAEVNRLHNQQYSMSWTHLFSDTLNEARFGYFRINYDAVEPQNPVNPTSYGFTGIIAQNPAAASIPVMSVSGLFTLGFSEYGPQPRLENTYQVIDNFSKVVGKHTLKAGFTTDPFQVYNPFYSFLSGYYSFSKSGGTYTTGDAGANFLLGLPGLYLQSNGAIIDTRARGTTCMARMSGRCGPISL